MGDSEKSTAAGGDPIVILKVRVRSIATSTYGIIGIMINKRLRKFQSDVCAFSHYASFFDDINPLAGWSEIAAQAASKRSKNELNTTLSKTIENNLLLSIDEDAADEILTNEENNEPSQLIPLISEHVTQAVGDKNVLFDAAFETTTTAELSSGSAAAPVENFASPGAGGGGATSLLSDLKAPEGEAAYVTASLVLAPVSGVPVYDVMTGNEIMVRVNNNTDREKAVNMRLNAIVDGKVLPVSGRVVEKRVGEKGECALLIKLAENIYTKVLETEAVKIKRGDAPSELGTLSPVKTRDKETPLVRIMIWALGGLLFLSALATLLYFMILK
ncbi:MAG: hypothetical protein AABZ39_07980 [Spirochaetota bacterium]